VKPSLLPTTRPLFQACRLAAVCFFGAIDFRSRNWITPLQQIVGLADILFSTMRMFRQVQECRSKRLSGRGSNDCFRGKLPPSRTFYVADVAAALEGARSILWPSVVVVMAPEEFEPLKALDAPVTVPAAKQE
jgi:hypothetical protein